MKKAVILSTLLGVFQSGIYGASYSYQKVAEVKVTDTSAVVAMATSSDGVPLVDVLDGKSETLNTYANGNKKQIYDLSLAKVYARGAALSANGNAAIESDTFPAKVDSAVYTLEKGVLKKIADSSLYAVPNINDRGDISVINFPGASARGITLLLKKGPDVATIAATYEGAFADLSSFTGGAINNTGQIVFAAYQEICDGGIYTGGDRPVSQVVPFSVVGLCLYAGSAISPSPWINDSGTIAFSALDFLRKTYGVYVKSKDGLRTIAESGIVEPGIFDQFGPVNINNAGTVVFYGRNTRTKVPGGIYTGPDPLKDKVIAEGDALFDSTVSLVLTPGASSTQLAPGQWPSVRYQDEQGRILFTYVLKDGRIGVAQAIPSQSSGPSVPTGGVVPIFGSAPVVQPGSWVSIYGTNLSTGTFTWNGDFPTMLGGVSVTINGKACYLWLVSPTQINLQVPDDPTTGIVDVVITTPAGSTKSTVTLAPRSPSFSLLDGRYPAVVIPTSDGKGIYGGGSYDLAGPTGHFAFNTRPIKGGEIITLYGVGFGPTSPSVPAGAPFSGAASTIIPVIVTIGGYEAKVLFSGITGAGLYQINVVAPFDLHGDQEVRASISGVLTQPNLYLTLQ